MTVGKALAEKAECGRIRINAEAMSCDYRAGLASPQPFFLVASCVPVMSLDGFVRCSFGRQSSVSYRTALHCRSSQFRKALLVALTQSRLFLKACGDWSPLLPYGPIASHNTA